MTGTADTLYIIVAMTRKQVIGKANKLPWHIPEELRVFKQLTEGSVVVMGRKTYESIGKPLPNRHNLVMSTTIKTLDGVEVFGNFEDAISRARQIGGKIFCIGGADVFRKALDRATHMYISWIKADYDGDVTFPGFDPSLWELLESENFEEFELCFYKKLPEPKD